MVFWGFRVTRECMNGELKFLIGVTRYEQTRWECRRRTTI